MVACAIVGLEQVPIDPDRVIAGDPRAAPPSPRPFPLPGRAPELRRIPEALLHLRHHTVDDAVANRDLLQGVGDCFKEYSSISRRKRLGGAHDGGKLGIGEGDGGAWR